MQCHCNRYILPYTRLQSHSDDTAMTAVQVSQSQPHHAFQLPRARDFTYQYLTFYTWFWASHAETGHALTTALASNEQSVPQPTCTPHEMSKLRNFNAQGAAQVEGRLETSLGSKHLDCFAKLQSHSSPLASTSLRFRLPPNSRCVKSCTSRVDSVVTRCVCEVFAGIRQF